MLGQAGHSVPLVPLVGLQAWVPAGLGMAWAGVYMGYFGYFIDEGSFVRTFSAEVITAKVCTRYFDLFIDSFFKSDSCQYSVTTKLRSFSGR